jgi:hypothetical protein
MLRLALVCALQPLPSASYTTCYTHCYAVIVLQVQVLVLCAMLVALAVYFCRRPLRKLTAAVIGALSVPLLCVYNLVSRVSNI